MSSENFAGKTALVLCGGGAPGAVEVGLYRALVELGVQFDFVVGSSIGAVNGALIAAGLSPAEIEEHWRRLRTRDVLGPRWQAIRLLWGAPSIYDNHRVRTFLQQVLPVYWFHQLKVPLYVVATDLKTGEAVVLDQGDLIEALLASTALPGVFPPMLWRGRQLVDGGLSDNVPIDVAVAHGAGRVIGILCGCGQMPGRHPGLISILGQSFALALQGRFRSDLRFYKDRIDVQILDPCPGSGLPMLDFDRAWTLIEPAYEHALKLLRRQTSEAPEAETRQGLEDGPLFGLGR
ncbi:MAG: patatin-like phospholipase family protein [Bryobacteraceae bacterium]|nr:patatin-like phospholipase family protein [Bryobacteraceae bacterium]